MITINPYLNFNGNCEEAFAFYKSVFGGDFSYLSRFKEMPPNPDYPLPEALREKIMHMSLPFSKETSLMGSDSTREFGGEAQFGNNVSLMVSAENKKEVDAIWAKLSEGATITMPLMDAFWGDYFGGLVDKFGVNWMLICPSNKPE